MTTVENAIRSALFDPGRYVEREYEPLEPLHVWQTRAVLRALDSMNGLQAIAQTILDTHYPADIALICDRDSPDPGPRLAAALRDCIEAMT